MQFQGNQEDKWTDEVHSQWTDNSIHWFFLRQWEQDVALAVAQLRRRKAAPSPSRLPDLEPGSCWGRLDLSIEEIGKSLCAGCPLALTCDHSSVNRSKLKGGRMRDLQTAIQLARGPKSVREAARRVGVPPYAVVLWELGKRVPCYPDFISYVGAFGYDVFLDGEVATMTRFPEEIRFKHGYIDIDDTLVDEPYIS